MGIGKKLKEVREEKNLTITEVEKATLIRKKYLKAIEKEQYDVISAEVYVKAFIKNYGDFLDLDGKKLAQSYQYQAKKEKEFNEKERKAQESNDDSFFEKYTLLIIMSSLTVFIIVIVFIYFYFFA